MFALKALYFTITCSCNCICDTSYIMLVILSIVCLSVHPSVCLSVHLSRFDFVGTRCSLHNTSLFVLLDLDSPPLSGFSRGSRMFVALLVLKEFKLII